MAWNMSNILVNEAIAIKKAGSGGGGSSTLSGLTDTTITTPSNGQVLKYDGTSEKWVNGNEASASLSDLTDTTITTPSNGQVLTYDSTSEKWVNASAGSGGGEVYPTTKTKVGTWGDKDLYRVIVSGSISSSGNSLQLPLASTDVVRRISGTFVKSNETYCVPYYKSASDYLSIYTKYINDKYTAFLDKSSSNTGTLTLIIDFTES